MLYFHFQSFTAKIKRGSSVKFTWVIDDLEKFVHLGEAYNVVFKKPSEYKLKVTREFPELVSVPDEHKFKFTAKLNFAILC